MYNIEEDKIVKGLDEFQKLLREDHRKSDEDNVVNDAFKIALDTRKFEIDLYWKRATYFWVFIGATFVAYFQFLTSKSEVTRDYKFFTIIISGVGYFLAIGWYFVNRGSKYWQENWEKHSSQLGGILKNPIFSIVNEPDNEFKNLTDGYPFSVSRVNHFLNLVMILFWSVAFIFSIWYSFNADCLIKIFIIIIALIILILLTLIFFQKAKSSIKKQYDLVIKKENIS